jgi:L-lactate utilization protein LutC
MARESVLHRVRTALGRSVDQPPAPAPPVRLRIPEVDPQERVVRMFAAIEALSGKTHHAATPDEARVYVEAVIQGRTAVASGAAILRECGITGLPGVRSGITDRAELRQLCATAAVGITGADYALADTGTVVLFSSPEEARMISLLPPAHIAVVPRDRILTGLDELFTLVPDPAALSSSMVFITGPSRTADIEQILVRGVHGPGELHVVVAGRP